MESEDSGGLLMSKKKIAFLLQHNPEYLSGGAEIQSGILANELSEKHEVFYIAGEPERNPPEKIFKFNDKVRIITYKKYKVGILELIEVIRIILKYDFDILYQRGRNHLSILFLLMRICKSKCKLVWGASFDKDSITRGYHDRQKLPKSSLKNILLNLYSAFIDFLSYFALKLSKETIVQNQKQYKLFRENFKQKSTVLYNFNYLSIPSIYCDIDGRKRVLWVANIKSAKQPEIFIELANRFSHRADVFFQMIGRASSNRKYQDELERKIAKVKNLEYLGEKPLEVVEEYLDRTYIFVNTSNHEGFPNTFIQAWLRGVPVLSLEIDPDNLISKHKLGKIAGSIDGLSSSLEYFLNKEDELKGYGERILEFARETFSVEKNIHKFEAILLR